MGNSELPGSLLLRDRALMLCPAQGRRTLVFMPLEQSFNPLNQLLPLEPPIPLPRFGEAKHEVGGIRLLEVAQWPLAMIFSRPHRQ